MKISVLYNCTSIGFYSGFQYLNNVIDISLIIVNTDGIINGYRSMPIIRVNEEEINFSKLLIL